MDPEPIPPLLDASTVRLAYELLLGRQPESEEAIKAHQALGSVSLLRKVMIGSHEYQKTNAPLLVGNLTDLWFSPRGKVEIEATPSELALLFERTRFQWEKLGLEEPDWSVLTTDKYKSSSFSQHSDEFYDSGRIQACIIEILSKHSGYGIPPKGVVLELGCGTGRVTHALAAMYAEVIAVDVSQEHLRLCEQRLGERNIKNVRYVLLESPEEIQNLPEVDFFFSTIVLQHNPPPVIHYLLDVVLSKINVGGAALFQVPTHTPGYSFDIQSYLASKLEILDMHCLPMAAVFDLLADNDFKPVEVLMDGSTGELGSHVFFAIRGGLAPPSLQDTEHAF